MADVALDHNMDVSIDTQGPLDNNDDIEIDLDIQEPVEDRDGDVMVDDASATASDHPEYQNDADMLDEDYSEGNAIDAEYSYQQSKEIQYTDQNTYEAEMEDEYEEDIDAPIPGTGALELQESITAEAHPKLPEPPVSEPSHSESKSPEHAKAPSPSPRAESVTPQGRPGESKPGESKEDEKTVQPEEDVAGQVQDEHYDERNEKAAQEPSGETEQYEPQSNENQQAVEPTEDVQDKDYTAFTEEDIDYQSSQESAEEIDLRNVKVLYQDSEISLFPPMEDDPTETYFLEDVALAHEPIGRLFNACRSVLNEHITEQEELVLDIESLNLHLSENASQNCSITLSHITKVYRDLSLNDGVNDPEPLYLTLSTRESFEFAYHNLLQFVEDGKGLSSIYSWDEYELEEAEGDTLIPEHDGAEVLKRPEEDRSDKALVQESTLEPEESSVHQETAEEPVQPPLGQSAQETPTVPAGGSPAPEGDADENVWRTSSEQGASEGGTQATKDEHSPRGAEQPGEDKNVGKANESGHQNLQEYYSSEEGYLELPNDVEQISQPDGLDDAEAAREEDAEGEYSIPDDANNAPKWPKEQEPPEIPTPQSQQQPAPEEANVDSLEDSGFDYVEIDVGEEEPALGKEENVDHPVENIDEPEIDISIENDGQPIHELDNGEAELPRVEIEAAPGTPGTSHGLFDIEEDIFKSPVAKPAVSPQMDDAHQEFTLQGTSKEHVQTGVETVSREAHPDVPELESGEVSAVEDEAFQAGDEKSRLEKSPSAKRPRSDDDNDALELSVPELKRHRSE